MNKVIETGYIASDVELKQTPNGTDVATFRLAVKRPHTNDTTDFFTVVCWRNTASFVAKYFKKGSGIEVSGVLTSRSWQDQNGNKRYAVEIQADEVDFGKKSQNDTADSANTESKDFPNGQVVPHFEEMNEDDDLPF